MQIKIHKPYIFSETGQRDNNEDAVFPEIEKAGEDTNFFIVCDGMGGYQRGEVASSVVVQSLASFLSKAEKLDEKTFREALYVAYDRLDKECDRGNINRQTGTTLAFLFFHKKGAFMAHIGDSRIYHLRKKEGQTKVLYQSEDHSYVNDLVKSGMITPDEAENHPRKNVITRAMQPHQEKRSLADVYETGDVRPGDYFFLCTDGVLEQVNNKKLCSILNMNIPFEKKGEAVTEACQGKSKDNFSGCLISIDEIDNNINPKQEPEKKNSLRKLLFFLSFLIMAGCAIFFLMQQEKEYPTKEEESVGKETENAPVPVVGDTLQVVPPSNRQITDEAPNSATPPRRTVQNQADTDTTTNTRTDDPIISNIDTLSGGDDLKETDYTQQNQDQP